MIPREVLKQVRRVEIATRGLVNDVFSGEYHSVFKGLGMSFAEVREYQYGDDIRNIDWNVTARAGAPFVKVFEEERELTVVLLVDVSGSGDFGTGARMKEEAAAEICAILAFSAIKNNDKVGLILFSDRIEKFVPPRKGRRHVLRVLRELIYTGRKGGVRTSAPRWSTSPGWYRAAPWCSSSPTSRPRGMSRRWPSRPGGTIWSRFASGIGGRRTCPTSVSSTSRMRSRANG